MIDLLTQVRAKLAQPPGQFNGMFSCHLEKGASSEHARTAPVVEALLECVAALLLFKDMEHIDTSLERALKDMDSSPESEGRGERYICTAAREALAKLERLTK